MENVPPGSNNGIVVTRYDVLTYMLYINYLLLSFIIVTMWAAISP